MWLSESLMTNQISTMLWYIYILYILKNHSYGGHTSPLRVICIGLSHPRLLLRDNGMFLLFIISITVTNQRKTPYLQFKKKFRFFFCQSNENQDPSQSVSSCFSANSVISRRENSLHLPLPFHSITTYLVCFIILLLNLSKFCGIEVSARHFTFFFFLSQFSWLLKTTGPSS